jgi:hypothetical protein
LSVKLGIGLLIDTPHPATESTATQASNSSAAPPTRDESSGRRPRLIVRI